MFCQTGNYIKTFSEAVYLNQSLSVWKCLFILVLETEIIITSNLAKSMFQTGVSCCVNTLLRFWLITLSLINRKAVYGVFPCLFWTHKAAPQYWLWAILREGLSIAGLSHRRISSKRLIDCSVHHVCSCWARAQSGKQEADVTWEDWVMQDDSRPAFLFVAGISVQVLRLVSICSPANAVLEMWSGKD